MVLQTSIEKYSKPGTAGQIASLNLFHIYQAIPALVNRSGAVIPYGVFVRLDSATNSVRPLSATGQTLLGVTVQNNALAHTYIDSAVKGVQIDDYVDAMTHGDVFVSCETPAARPGDPVFVRHTANGGLGVIGGVANAAGTGLDAVPQARFVSTVSNGLAVINVNLP
jgi:hypothetical protein